jgi:cold shock CspA family protein
MSLNTGIVKWFNVKSGYGFITLLGGDSSRVGADVFVHHGSLVTKENYYRYLVQGEYVNFEIVKLSTGPHEFHATNVSGVMAGPLMCETLADTGRQIRAFNPKQQQQRTDKTTTQKKQGKQEQEKKQPPKNKP